jgi:hypothetical protein
MAPTSNPIGKASGRPTLGSAVRTANLEPGREYHSRTNYRVS